MKIPTKRVDYGYIYRTVIGCVSIWDWRQVIFVLSVLEIFYCLIKGQGSYFNDPFYKNVNMWNKILKDTHCTIKRVASGNGMNISNGWWTKGTSAIRRLPNMCQTLFLMLEIQP